MEDKEDINTPTTPTPDGVKRFTLELSRKSSSDFPKLNKISSGDDSQLFPETEGELLTNTDRLRGLKRLMDPETGLINYNSKPALVPYLGKYSTIVLFGKEWHMGETRKLHLLQR